MKKTLIGQVAPEQVAEWKKEHKLVKEVICDGHICYLHGCGRKVLSAATVGGGKDPIKFNEILIENLWLGGSEIFKTDDDYFLSVGPILAELIASKAVETKNL